jgi:hypothetical protein
MILECDLGVDMFHDQRRRRVSVRLDRLHTVCVTLKLGPVRMSVNLLINLMFAHLLDLSSRDDVVSPFLMSVAKLLHDVNCLIVFLTVGVFFLSDQHNAIKFYCSLTHAFAEA